MTPHEHAGDAVFLMCIGLLAAVAAFYAVVHVAIATVRFLRRRPRKPVLPVARVLP